MLRKNNRGISRIGLVIVIACLLILLAAILPPLAAFRSGDKQSRLTVLNAANLKTIDQAMHMFAADNNGILPVPGLIDRAEEPYTKSQQQGVGPHDVAKNTTANFYSAMLALEYFGSSILISPRERNPLVTECTSYDYTSYDPTADTYWDSSFVADLKTGSNVSYAHMPLTNKRVMAYWRDTREESVVLMGSRGPEDGVASADSHSCQKTGQWFGVVNIGSGKVMAPSAQPGNRITWRGLDPNDNPFNIDPRIEGFDQFIAFTKEMTDGEPVIQHD